MYQEGTPLATQQPGVPSDLCPKRCSISRPLRLLFPLLKMLLPPDLFNIQCLSGHDLNLNATFLEKPFQTHPIKLPSYPPAILYLIPCFIFFIDFSQPETSLFVCLFVFIGHLCPLKVQCKSQESRCIISCSLLFTQYPSQALLWDTVVPNECEIDKEMNMDR